MDEEIIINSDYPLNGILKLPANDKKYPLVILVHGSGVLDMDETIYANKPFLDIADYLCKNGIATLRYNKRTFQHKKEVLEDSKTTPITILEETIIDALSAKKQIMDHPNIDQDNIFLLGHSLGGMVAPRIDYEGGNFKGIIIMAGSLRSLREIIKDQNNDSLHSLNKIFQVIGKGQIKKLNSKFDLVDSLSESEAKKTKMLNHATIWYFKEMESFDYINTLQNINKPVFIIQGEKDFQVKANVDYMMYLDICHENKNISFKLYPNLNHLFMPSSYGEINKAKQEYSIKSNVSEEVLEDICMFIRKAVEWKE